MTQSAVAPAVTDFAKEVSERLERLLALAVDGGLDEAIGKMATAIESAFAKALNMPSAMWWLLRPLSNLMCRFMRATVPSAWKKSSSKSRSNVGHGNLKCGASYSTQDRPDRSIATYDSDSSIGSKKNP